MKSLVPCKIFDLKIAVIGISTFSFPRISEDFSKVSLLIPAVATFVRARCKISLESFLSKQLWFCTGKKSTFSNFFGELTTKIPLTP